MPWDHATTFRKRLTHLCVELQRSLSAERNGVRGVKEAICARIAALLIGVLVEELGRRVERVCGDLTDCVSGDREQRCLIEHRPIHPK